VTEHVATAWLAWLAIATPVIVVAIQVADLRRQRVLMERLGELPAVRRMMAARSPGRRIVKAVLWGLGLGLILLAAARPGCTGTQVTKRKGMDVVIAIDVSKSMLVGDVEIAQPPRGWPEDLEDDAPRPVPDDAEWVQGTRLERARQLLTALAPRLPDDRIAIVLFAGASIHFPITDDEALAVQLAHLVGPTDLIGGSDIGEALRVGRCLLRDELHGRDSGCGGLGVRGRGGEPLAVDDRTSRRRRPRVEERATEERGKAILVLTDGGATDPSVVEEVHRAQQLGVSIFFVGIGSDDGGVVPELDWQGKVAGAKKDATGQPVRSKLDRAGLRELARLAGGHDRYVEIAPRGMFDLAPIVDALGKVHRGELERTEHDKRKEHYQPFLFAGFMLLVIDAAIGLRRRVKHPEVVP
jgi:Ca-activated chloride channel homolog